MLYSRNNFVLIICFITFSVKSQVGSSVRVFEMNRPSRDRLGSNIFNKSIHSVYRSLNNSNKIRTVRYVSAQGKVLQLNTDTRTTMAKFIAIQDVNKFLTLQMYDLTPPHAQYNRLLRQYHNYRREEQIRKNSHQLSNKQNRSLTIVKGKRSNKNLKPNSSHLIPRKKRSDSDTETHKNTDQIRNNNPAYSDSVQLRIDSLGKAYEILYTILWNSTVKDQDGSNFPNLTVDAETLCIKTLDLYYASHPEVFKGNYFLRCLYRFCKIFRRVIKYACNASVLKS